MVWWNWRIPYKRGWSHQGLCGLEPSAAFFPFFFSAQKPSPESLFLDPCPAYLPPSRFSLQESQERVSVHFPCPAGFALHILVPRQKASTFSSPQSRLATVAPGKLQARNMPPSPPRFRSELIRVRGDTRGNFPAEHRTGPVVVHVQRYTSTACCIRSTSPCVIAVATPNPYKPCLRLSPSPSMLSPRLPFANPCPPGYFFLSACLENM